MEEKKLRIATVTRSADLRLCRFWLPVSMEVKVHRQKGSQLRIALKKKGAEKCASDENDVSAFCSRVTDFSAPQRHETHVNAGQLQQGVENEMWK